MKSNCLHSVLVVLAATTLASCATVARGTKQNFEFLSEPVGAEVTTTHGINCMTPCNVKLKRKEAFTATFKKFGYATQSTNVRSKFSGGGAAAGAGNILLGGIIGAGVDASNGSLNNLSPSPLMVVLKPILPVVPVTSAPALVSPAPILAASPATDTAVASLRP